MDSNRGVTALQSHDLFVCVGGGCAAAARSVQAFPPVVKVIESGIPASGECELCATWPMPTNVSHQRPCRWMAETFSRGACWNALYFLAEHYGRSAGTRMTDCSLCCHVQAISQFGCHLYFYHFKNTLTRLIIRMNGHISFSFLQIHSDFEFLLTYALFSIAGKGNIQFSFALKN